MPVGNRRTDRITLVGASARAAAESARRAGIETLAFDLFGDEDTRAACQWRPLKSIAVHLQEIEDTEIVLLGGMEARPRLHRLLRRSGAAPPLRFPWYRDACTWIHQMDRLVRGSAFRWPETRRNPPTDRRGWVRKRIDSAGGVSVAPAEQGHAKRDGSWIWQRNVPGESLSAALLLTAGTVRWLGAACSLPPAADSGASPFSYGGSLRLEQPSPLLVNGSLEIGQRLRSRYGVRGLVGIDFIARPDALWLLEINSRYTASMELHEAPDQSLIAAHLDAIRGLPVETHEPTELRGKKIVYATNGTIVSKRLGTAVLEKARQSVAGERVAITLHDRPLPGTQVRRAAPLCTVMGRGPNGKAIAAALQTAERALLQELQSLALDEPALPVPAWQAPV